MSKINWTNEELRVMDKYSDLIESGKLQVAFQNIAKEMDYDVAKKIIATIAYLTEGPEKFEIFKVNFVGSGRINLGFPKGFGISGTIFWVNVIGRYSGKEAREVLLKDLPRTFSNNIFKEIIEKAIWLGVVR